MTSLAAPRLAFTDEQQAAIDARGGSGLLSASAGSGKTAVMVESFVQAVLADGVAVSEILALTFTEKAAGELRERLRKRFSDLGEDDLARETESAWVGTIHGFCARVLREEPLVLGLDPRFTVLDEPTAGRLATRALDQALEQWIARHGESALDVAAAYGPTLSPLLMEVFAELRSRGQTRPRLPLPPSPRTPNPQSLLGPLQTVTEALPVAADGAMMRKARVALTACRRRLEACTETRSVPRPGELLAGRLPTGGAALATADCVAYRDAWAQYVQSCADFHAAAALILLDDLLDCFGRAYAEAKAARAGVDFADLELLVRDLFVADESARQRWSERFSRLMIDEFQDTNRVQLDVLEALERGNLSAVGDEFQSIYGFRHADVTIFRERRAALGDGAVMRLTANFRSRKPVLDVVNHAFTPIFGEHFAPLRPGGQAWSEFADEPLVELLVTHCRGWDELASGVGLSAFPDPVFRRAEARVVARRVRAELDAGRRPGEVVLLLRSTSSLRLFEQALEEEGVPTYVLGGRGYWSQEQVRDALAYLGAVANPLDEQALFGALASPFCSAGTDALVLLAEAGRHSGRGAWAALKQLGAAQDGFDGLDPAEQERLRRFASILSAHRELAEGISVEQLLDEAVTELGYDLAVLARQDGDRRLANVRKLMRMAREYERAEGADLRGFIAFAEGEDLREAREGEAPLEAEDLDAVRLMTIHRAKGLEFPVVVIADLGRQGSTSKPALLVGRDGRIGLRLATVGAGDRTDSLHYRTLADERAAAEDDEERRLLYVALTRAEEKLILSGATDLERLPTARPGGAPLAWLLPALLPAPAAAALADAQGRAANCTVVDCGGAPLKVAVTTPDSFATGVAVSAGAQAGSSHPMASSYDGRLAGRTLRGVAGSGGHGVERHNCNGNGDGDGDGDGHGKAGREPAGTSVSHAGRAARVSYSSLSAYARCSYRFYLQRVLGLPDAPVPVISPAGTQLVLSMDPAVSPRVRGRVVHALLEGIDFARPKVPSPEQVAGLLAGEGVSQPSAADLQDIRGLVSAFARSPLCSRLAQARRVRREAPFACTPFEGGEPLLTGFLDVWAQEEDAGVLIVDYKTDRLGDTGPREAVDLHYGLQQAVYALAALNDGAREVRVAYCFLERSEHPVLTRFRASDVPALARQVTARAQGILNQQWPVAQQPHRDLCGDCPGRVSLCSHPEALTLRDPSIRR